MLILQRIKNLSIQIKIPLLNFLFVALVFIVLVWIVESSLSKLVEDRAVADVSEKTKLLVQLIDTSDKDLKGRISLLGDAFKNNLGNDISLVDSRVRIGERETPVLALNGAVLNLNFSVVDKFTLLTGAVATIFVKDGDDFIRISTSLKNEREERAVGTLLDRNHPGYQSVIAGKSYVGLATLFGRNYITKYDPILNSNGVTIGLSFVGMDFTRYLNDLKSTIRQIKVGKTGYFYILDSRDGPNYGNLVVHPTLEGRNTLKMGDATGQAVFKEILDNKDGVTHYMWSGGELDVSEMREKVVAYSYLKSWNWIIAGGTYVDEYTEDVKEHRVVLYLVGGLLVLVISGFTAFLLNKWVSQPLRQVQEAAQRLAKGDLRVSMDTSTLDEIGQVKQSINTIGSGLSGVVHAVRSSAQGMLAASVELSEENVELSRRTDSQFKALSLATDSMGTLNATVKQNAESARDVKVLAANASAVASQSGVVVAQAVSTMGEISESSKKISDIVGVIDAIAFQTNILALNAAVEAARAGEHGRGFAVVASEVRTLAGRSAVAAKEIKDLIDISQSKVTQGNTFVSNAGQTMTEVVNATSSVTGLIDDISLASSEQANSVDSVLHIVAQLNEGTHENTVMVEQMSNASMLLNSKASELVDVVSVFQLTST